MRVLSIDIGTGTQDILLLDTRLGIENGCKMVVPSPTMIVRRQIQEAAYRVQRECLDHLDAPIERVTSDDVPMPYALNLEKEVMPQVKDVVAAVNRVLYLDE